MNDKPSLLRETDDDARRQARVLLRSLRHAPLAVLDPDSGFPSISRVLVGADIDGVPVILVSALSAHTRALLADPHASLLAGEPGKGDPLAHPRLSLQCLAERVEGAGVDHARIRGRFLARHPKAALYIDFPDFMFFRLEPHAASLNGGFGKAYLLSGEDFIIRSPVSREISDDSETIVRELLEQHSQMLTRVTRGLRLDSTRSWKVCGVDAAGFELFSGENMLRVDFEHPMDNYMGINSYISKIEYSIPEI